MLFFGEIGFQEIVKLLDMLLTRDNGCTFINIGK